MGGVTKREPEQLDLYGGGLAEKNRGIDQVIGNTAAWYRSAFIAEILKLVRGEEFTSEDITRRIGPSPGHPSAVGALMNAAYKAGYCEPTGKHERALRRRSHAALLTIWRRV